MYVIMARRLKFIPKTIERFILLKFEYYCKEVIKKLGIYYIVKCLTYGEP